MRAGVIDIGSNSIKLTIGERQGDDIKVLESLKSVLPMGKYTFFKGSISQEIIKQTISLIQKYQQTLKEYEVADLTVIATTAVREARNKDLFLDVVKRKTGLDIDVLNVGDVIYYIDSYLSQKLKKAYPILEKNLVIAELGAGSFDISLMQKGYTLMNVGFPIGTLRLKQFMQSLDGSGQEILQALEEAVDHEFLYLKNLYPNLNVDDIILIDENYSVYLQNILPNKKRESNFFQLKASEAQELLEKLTEINPDEIAATYKIPVEMANTIVGYTFILNGLFNLTKSKHIYILETSLAEAILASMLSTSDVSTKKNKMNQLISVANFLCQQYCLDIKHARHVADLSETIFTSVKEQLGLTENDLLYLILAAYLHDIGIFINNRAHHKHSEYIINGLNLFRLTEEEIKVIACIARYHRRGAPSSDHPLYNSLDLQKKILVQKLSAILRIANAFDRSHKQKTKKLEVNLTSKEEIALNVHTTHNFLLEKAGFMENKNFFEEITH